MIGCGNQNEGTSFQIFSPQETSVIFFNWMLIDPSHHHNSRQSNNLIRGVK